MLRRRSRERLRGLGRRSRVYTSASQASSPTPPSAPSNFAASNPGGPDFGKANLTWTAGAGATGYKLYGRVAGVGSYTLFTTIGNVTSYQDSTVNYGISDYDLKLTSINADGESTASNVATTDWGGG